MGTPLSSTGLEYSCSQALREQIAAGTLTEGSIVTMVACPKYPGHRPKDFMCKPTGQFSVLGEHNFLNMRGISHIQCLPTCLMEFISEASLLISWPTRHSKSDLGPKAP